jgi:hypothetical protein
MAIFQDAGDEVVTVREQIARDDDGFAERALDRESAAVYGRLQSLDDDAAAVTNPRLRLPAHGAASGPRDVNVHAALAVHHIISSESDARRR